MSRLHEWFKAQAPTQESFENNRFLKPFAKRVFHPALWRFTRRSVPRGVAMGLLVGIFLLIPGLQIVGTALLSLPVRANIPLGAAMTFLSNPLTTPLILAASIYVGNSILHLGADMDRLRSLIENNAPLVEWANWLLSEAAPAMLTGLAIIAVVSAAVGYVVAALVWRWWLVRKWRRRGHGKIRLVPRQG
jgi:uncharacterized protein (DUF2062 family)